MPALNLATLDQVLGTVKYKHGLNNKVKQASVFSISATNILVYYLWVRLGAYPKTRAAMEQRTLKHVNNNLNTNIYSYMGTSGGQSSDLFLKCCSFFKHQCALDSCDSLRLLLFSCIDV